MRSVIIPGYSNYSINEQGVITNTTTMRIISQRNNRGYWVCNLYNDQRIEKTVKVHRLLGICFIPNPENKSQINHIDGDRSNYSLDNLEWVTPSENSLHAYRIGLAKVSDYCRQRASETNKGVPKSQEHRDKIGEGNSKRAFWTHDKHGDFYGSSCELVSAFPEQKLDFSNLAKIRRGLRGSLTHKGWKLKI